MSDPRMIATVQLHLSVCEGEPRELVDDSLVKHVQRLDGSAEDAALTVTGFQLDSIEAPAAPEKFTVVFFTDVDSVETYIQHIEAGPDDDAFDLAVQQAMKEWGGPASDWESATEIARFPGHIHQQGDRMLKPIYTTKKAAGELEISACENCGNTDQDGTDDCIDCGQKDAFG